MQLFLLIFLLFFCNFIIHFFLLDKTNKSNNKSNNKKIGFLRTQPAAREINIYLVMKDHGESHS